MLSAFCISSQTCIHVVLTCSSIIVQDAQTLHEAAKMGDIEAARRLLNEVSKSADCAAHFELNVPCKSGSPCAS